MMYLLETNLPITGTNRTMGDGAAQPGRRPTIQSLGTRFSAAFPFRISRSADAAGSLAPVAPWTSSLIKASGDPTGLSVSLVAGKDGKSPAEYRFWRLGDAEASEKILDVWHQAASSATVPHLLEVP